MTQRKSTRRKAPQTSSPADVETAVVGFDFTEIDLKRDTLPKLEWVPEHSHPGLYPGQIIIDDPNTMPRGAVPPSSDRPGACRCTRGHVWEDVWNSSVRSTCAVCAISQDKMTSEVIAGWDMPDAGFATYEGHSDHLPKAVVGHFPQKEGGKRIAQRQARMRYLLEREFPEMTTHDLRPYWLRSYKWECKDDFKEAWARLGQEQDEATLENTTSAIAPRQTRTHARQLPVPAPPSADEQLQDEDYHDNMSEPLDYPTPVSTSNEGLIDDLNPEDDEDSFKIDMSDSTWQQPPSHTSDAFLSDNFASSVAAQARGLDDREPSQESLGNLNVKVVDILDGGEYFVLVDWSPELDKQLDYWFDHLRSSSELSRLERVMAAVWYMHCPAAAIRHTAVVDHIRFLIQSFGRSRRTLTRELVVAAKQTL